MSAPAGYAPPAHYPPPTYYAPPHRDNTALIIVVVVVLVIAVPMVLAGLLYIIVSGLIGAPTPSRPLISLSLSQSYAFGATLIVVGVQGPQTPPSAFGVNLQVGNFTGTPIPFPVSQGNSAALTIDPATYTFTWNDVDGSGTISHSDTFVIAYPSSGGPGAETTVTFILLWSDGSPIAQTTWTV